MCKPEADPERAFLNKLSIVVKTVFDFLTRVTLAGVINQIGITVDNTTIKLISYALYTLLIAQFVFNANVYSDFTHGFFRRRFSKFWVGGVFFLLVIAIPMGFFHFFLMTAIRDVFVYYSELASN